MRTRGGTGYECTTSLHAKTAVCVVTYYTCPRAGHRIRDALYRLGWYKYNHLRNIYAGRRLNWTQDINAEMFGYQVADSPRSSIGAGMTADYVKPSDYRSSRQRAGGIIRVP